MRVTPAILAALLFPPLAAVAEEAGRSKEKEGEKKSFGEIVGNSEFAGGLFGL